MVQTFHCPGCGAPLDAPTGNSGVIRCPFCNSSVIVPKELREGKVSGQVLTHDEAASSRPGIVETMTEVVTMVNGGQEENAIRILNQRFEIGIQEAKTVVDAISHGELVQLSDIALRPHISDMDHPSRNLDGILELIRSGNKIEAIKIYKERSGSSLSEAKRAMDELELNTKYGITANIPYFPEPGSGRVDQSRVDRARKVRNIVTMASGGASCFVVGTIVFSLLMVIVPLSFALLGVGGPWEELGLKWDPFARANITLAFGDEGTGAGLFQDPRNISVTPGGDIFIAEYSDGRIQRFNSDGNFLNSWNVGKNRIISSMDVNREGEVFAVVDGNINRYEGATGSALGTLVIPDDEYGDSIAITPDGGLAAVVGGDTIVRYDPAGNVLFRIEDAVETVAEESELDARVAIDGLGNMYLLGSFTYSVFQFSAEGKYLNRWGAQGDEEGQFQAPYAIAVDGRGRIYTSDIKGIQVFDSDGRYLHRIRVKGFVFGMDFNDNGDLFVISNGLRVYRYDVDE